MQTTLRSDTPMYQGPWPTTTAAPAQTKHFRRGEIIFAEEGLGRRPYQLLSGEIVILRQGRPVDLIEPGEWLDGWGLSNTIAVAWRDTIVATHI